MSARNAAFVNSPVRSARCANPRPSETNPKWLGAERKRLGWLLALLPVLVVAGAWAGSKFSPAAAQLHPTVALAERYVRQQSHPVQYGLMTPEALSLQRAAENPEAILTAAADLRHRFDLACCLFGGWIGLVIGLKLVALSVRPSRTDYEPDRGACLACARCFTACPNERVRLGLMPAAEGTRAVMNTLLFIARLCLTAWIAGVFCLLVCGVMVYEHFAAATNDPWKSPQLLALKEKLAAEPKNEPLQKEIRQLDLKFRQKFRHRLALDKTGAWLLLGGVLVLVLAAGKAAALKKTLPLPQPKTDAGEQSMKLASRARWSLAGVGLVVAGSLLMIRLGNTSVLPANQAAWQKLLGQTRRAGGAGRGGARPV